jgi:dethiobiotin synthetase
LKKAIFITATNTGIGKTYATLLLLETLAKRGLKVGAFKPIETGVLNIPQDGKKLYDKSKKLNPRFKDISLSDVVPITFKLPAAPIVAKEESSIDFQKIKQAFLKISKVCDIVLIEGAGGLLVPIEEDFFMVDFIDFFDAKTLLVTLNKLGCINDALLSINILHQKNIKFLWCINEKYDCQKFKKITLPFYKNKFNEVYMLQSNIETIVDKLLII